MSKSERSARRNITEKCQSNANFNTERSRRNGEVFFKVNRGLTEIDRDS